MKLLQELRVHFLIVGTLLFVGYFWLKPGETATSDEELRRFYEANRKRFQVPPRLAFKRVAGNLPSGSGEPRSFFVCVRLSHEPMRILPPA